MTPKELSDQARSLPFDDLVREVTPLLSKYAARYVTGFDREDVMQELLEVLYTTQLSYDPARGGFLNILIISINHRIAWLGRKGRSQVSPITRVTCPTCDTVQPMHRWGPGYRCAACGSRKLDVARGTLQSLDERMDPARWNEGEGVPWMDGPEYIEIGYDVVDATDMYHRLPADRQQEIAAEIWT